MSKNKNHQVPVIEDAEPMAENPAVQPVSPVAAPERVIGEHEGRIAILADGQPVAFYNSKEAALADL